MLVPERLLDPHSHVESHHYDCSVCQEMADYYLRIDFDGQVERMARRIHAGAMERLDRDESWEVSKYQDWYMHLARAALGQQ